MAVATDFASRVVESSKSLLKASHRVEAHVEEALVLAEQEDARSAFLVANSLVSVTRALAAQSHEAFESSPDAIEGICQVLKIMSLRRIHDGQDLRKLMHQAMRQSTRLSTPLRKAVLETMQEAAFSLLTLRTYLQSNIKASRIKSRLINIVNAFLQRTGVDIVKFSMFLRRVEACTQAASRCPGQQPMSPLQRRIIFQNLRRVVWNSRALACLPRQVLSPFVQELQGLLKCP